MAMKVLILNPNKYNTSLKLYLELLIKNNKSLYVFHTSTIACNICIN